MAAQPILGQVSTVAENMMLAQVPQYHPYCLGIGRLDTEAEVGEKFGGEEILADLHSLFTARAQTFSV